MELILKDTKNLLTISDAVFCQNFNEALVHQVVTAYASTARQGTRSQKSRAEVTGSNRKPWKQKGTGRARSGSTKSPIWRSGGVTFAAYPKDYKQKINKKMYRGALRSIFSELIRQNRLSVIEKIILEIPKTKLLIQKLKTLNLENVLIITNKFNKNLFLSARNLQKIDVYNTTNINLLSLISFNNTLITVNAIKQIEELLI